LIAIFGTTISPYLFFWQAAEEMEEHDETARTVTRAEMGAMHIDVVAGIAAGVAVMFAILTATAVTLGQHPGGIQTADQAARALRPVAGGFASLLFAAGIVGTGLLAIPPWRGRADTRWPRRFTGGKGCRVRCARRPASTRSSWPAWPSAPGST
jgi:Mn2+/Fe2+ NRAMP family transporter